MKALVGYTGFVGSNLYEAGEFDAVYNSKNIQDAFGLSPDLLVYAGVRAEKYLANHEPSKDKDAIIEAEENIKRINPRKLVLISTIDVFKNPYGADEETVVDTEGLNAYGYNRYLLESWVRKNYPDALIIRLPGLFGKNIKKNFIYDFINLIPFMLKEEKFIELSEKEPILKEHYRDMGNGFYKLNDCLSERERLKQAFIKLGFTALNFTDSRSRYQFYNLGRLWTDLNTALDSGLTVWHPATEPVLVSELYQHLTGKEFTNELSGIPANYDYHTLYSELFGGKNDYICDKESIMEEIRVFVNEEHFC